LLRKAILEIGCSNGWRVERLIERYNCKAKGIDPAVPRMPHPTTFTNLHHGHAAALFHYGNAEFDTIIYGFCLYLCDPQDYASIVKECDRSARRRGNVIIHDFAVTDNEQPWRTPYKHKEGYFRITSSSNACGRGSRNIHRSRGRRPTRNLANYVVLLRKDLAGAFIDKPNP